MAFIFILFMAVVGFSLMLTPLYQKNKVIAIIAFVLLIGSWGMGTMSLMSDSSSAPSLTASYMVLGIR